MELNIVIRGIFYNPYKEELLFVRRSNHNLIWELPGGKLEPDEELENAILREIKEETGIDSEIEKLAYAKICKFDNKKPLLMLVYILTTTESDVKLSLEHIDYRWISINDVMNWEYLESNIFDEFNKYDVIDELVKISEKIKDF